MYQQGSIHSNGIFKSNNPSLTSLRAGFNQGNNGIVLSNFTNEYTHNTFNAGNRQISFWKRKVQKDICLWPAFNPVGVVSSYIVLLPPIKKLFVVNLLTTHVICSYVI